MTESKDLARRVEKLEADRDALAAELKALKPKCPSYMPDWPNHGAAIADPVFQQIRGIMGTQNFGQDDALRQAVLHALRTFESSPKPGAFRLGDLVKKVSGSAWEGRIVGTYSTALTPEGYAVESASHPGSVQIYPAKALTLVIQEAGD